MNKYIIIDKVNHIILHFDEYEYYINTVRSYFEEEHDNEIRFYNSGRIFTIK